MWTPSNSSPQTAISNMKSHGKVPWNKPYPQGIQFFLWTPWLQGTLTPPGTGMSLKSGSSKLLGLAENNPQLHGWFRDPNLKSMMIRGPNILLNIIFRMAPLWWFLAIENIYDDNLNILGNLHIAKSPCFTWDLALFSGDIPHKVTKKFTIMSSDPIAGACLGVGADYLLHGFVQTWWMLSSRCWSNMDFGYPAFRYAYMSFKNTRAKTKFGQMDFWPKLYGSFLK